MGQEPRRQADASSGATSVELLRRARGGDRAALEHLLARYVPRLRRWASGRLPRGLRDHVDTDDIVQDALIRTVGRLGEFQPQGPGAFHAYLRRALRHRIVDEVRRAGRRPTMNTLDETQSAGTASPLEAAIGQEALDAYEGALARLDSAAREAIIARVELGLSYAEVAIALGRPSPDAARMVVGRALIRLAEEMGRGRE